MNFYTPLKRKKKILKNKHVNRVTRVLSADSGFPTIPGKCKQLSNGKIRAWYTLDEYADCLEIERIGAAKESA